MENKEKANLKKVFVVQYNSYANNWAQAIFSKKKDAENFINKANGTSVLRDCDNPSIVKFFIDEHIFDYWDVLYKVIIDTRSLWYSGEFFYSIEYVYNKNENKKEDIIYDDYSDLKDFRATIKVLGNSANDAKQKAKKIFEESDEYLQLLKLLNVRL